MNPAETDVLVTIMAYTNRTAAANALCEVNFPALASPAADQSKHGSIGALLCLTNGSVVDLRLDVTEDTDIEFHHADATLIKIGP